MASGPCAAPTGRRHGRTDHAHSHSQINLANGEPSRHGEGQVVQAGKSIAFLEGKLMDLSGTVIARATASARLVPSEKALAA